MAEATKEILKAAKKGDLAQVQALVAKDRGLLAARDSDGSTPLHCAAWKGHREVVAFLLSAGADANARNENDHWGTTPLHAAAHANQAAIAELLIASGAEVNARDPNGRTPLEHTTFHKATAATRLLQKHSAV